ncbi:hypothetical protein [Flammeovirga agarivorans]|uniref:Uncharacterized protein n=1 Tax=Flammeovirga agarivorans TaxID=2726742 RepID=A0A7X8SQL3_9BACT|nr:hypothetical protein [Flammeovirga agarivorans]NLR94604.1 hypothetical protein [Flammeovirga agarivorans]
MRIKKVRGHRRRWKKIDNWIEYNKNLNLDVLKRYEKEYAKVYIQPWCNLSLRNSVIAPPKGKTKMKILQGLLDIFNSWKEQLKQLDEEYYLKIWLYERDISKSQVVCAIGSNISYYEELFHQPNKEKVFHSKNYGNLYDELDKLQWTNAWEEDHYDEQFIDEPENYVSRKAYEEEKLWFEKLLKKPHRLSYLDYSRDRKIEQYSFKKGEIWIGEE